MAPPKPKTKSIALALLEKAHDAESTTRIYEQKVLDRPYLHIKPTEPDNKRYERRMERLRKLEKRKRKLKPAPLSAKKKRALCLYEIPKEQQKYSIYEPLHQMWIGYIQEVLWDGGKFYPINAATAAKLCSADFHGAELEIVRSRCPSRVGVKGIVVKDTKFVFEIVTRKDVVKIMPKEHTLFRFTIPRPEEKKDTDGVKDKLESPPKDIPEDKAADASAPSHSKDLIFEIHGDQFIFRAADRSNKKFKSHFLPDL